LTEAGDRPALDERLVAEQDERRRLAELIHDGPVQYLAAVTQMLDAALAGGGSIGGGGDDDEDEGTRRIVRRALELTREASSDLRELVTGLEPDALRDEGFARAVHLLVERVAGRRGIAAEVEIADDALLGENASVGLYQIVRESLDQAIRRGPPSSVSIRLATTEHRGVELHISDNGSRERRQAVLDGLAERAASLNAVFEAETRPGEGTVIRVVVPPATAGR
jgi:signal transduction histidine kinase